MFEIIKLAFWGAVLFLALSFFGISIQAIVNSPAGQANFVYLANLAASFWTWLMALVAGLPHINF